MVRSGTEEESANTAAEQTAVVSAAAHCQVAALIRRLEHHHLRAAILQRGAQYVTTGVTARVALGSLAGLPVAGALSGAIETRVPDRGLSVVYAALRAGIPVTVTIIDPAGRASDDSLAGFRLKFCEFLDSASIDRELLGLCLSSGELPSPEFRSSMRPSLGDGPRYVMLHEHMAGDVWELLRVVEGGVPRFWPAYPSGVRSQCPLLSGESSCAVLPGSGIVAPVGTAWLPLHLDVCDFADDRGRIDWPRLALALDASVDIGDRLLEHLSWFDVRQSRDAEDNRRLAVCVTGFGELVLRRRRSPAEFACLQSLDRLLCHVRERLWSRSRLLAHRRGALPALAGHSPGIAWRDDAHRRDWQQRWQKAVSHVQLRHRNLLALSPYALLPRSARPSPEFGDLLPLLLHADALYFSSPPSLSHWNANEFSGFHQRIAALVRRHNAAAFVAAGV